MPMECHDHLEKTDHRIGIASQGIAKNIAGYWKMSGSQILNQQFIFMNSLIQILYIYYRFNIYIFIDTYILYSSKYYIFIDLNLVYFLFSK